MPFVEFLCFEMGTGKENTFYIRSKRVVFSSHTSVLTVALTV